MEKIMPLMGHLVLGYPNLATSEETIHTYVRFGVSILELQIPFSDPMADGHTIHSANLEALKAGTTTQSCFELLQRIRLSYPEQTIIPMTYANKVFHFGIEKWAKKMLELNMPYQIIPDLPLDSPQAKIVTNSGLELVPVLAANVPKNRIEKIVPESATYIYLQSDFKITGQNFSLHPDVQETIKIVRALAPKAKIGLGFGISTAEHLKAIAPFADFGIIGSALINAQKQGQLEEKLQELVGE